jgi:hypothetical protein
MSLVIKIKKIRSGLWFRFTAKRCSKTARIASAGSPPMTVRSKYGEIGYVEHDGYKSPPLT